MTRINLLPWRELRRRERDRQFLSISIGAWVLMGLAVFYGHLHVSGLVEHQNKRNLYLKGEITKVNKEIKEIQNIRRRRESLIARMEVIQQLQRDRTQIVHVFDDLVQKLPKGVFFTGLRKKGRRMTLTGFAQSNARVSALMRSLDASVWFRNPNLNVINVTPKGGSRVSKFTLQVSEEAPKKATTKTPTKQAVKPKTASRG